MKVEADGGAGDGIAVHQDPLHEFFRRQAGERGIEGQHHRAVEPGRGEQPQLPAFIGEPEHRLLRAQDGGRMRLEGQGRSGAAGRPRARQRRGNDRPVAAMHAVEIADRQHGAAQRRAWGTVALDDEGLVRGTIRSFGRQFPWAAAH